MDGITLLNTTLILSCVVVGIMASTVMFIELFIEKPKITEDVLKKLGFVREEGDNFYYYTLDIGICLISCANGDVLDEEWYVEVFNHEEIIFNNRKDLEKLINILNKARK